MTTWVLALLLLASLAGLGYRQGAVRVAFSLMGIFLGALLAVPLGRVMKPLLGMVSIKNPVLIWVLGPLLVFLIISIAFKIAALAAHQKVDVYYKYKAGDLRMVLWERLNRRVGLCLGLVNGTLYLILISWIIYAFSYWTFQMATSDGDPKGMKILNSLGRDLHNSGFAKVAGAVDHLSPAYYNLADVAGLIYNNSLLEARLSRYPGFLGLGERQEFQDLANDQQFLELRQQQKPFMEVVNHPKADAILSNPDLLRTIWATVTPDLKDLVVFLDTAKSSKYDPEKILGRWNFNVNASLAVYRKVKPNTSSTDMLKMKKWMIGALRKTSFVATPEHQGIFKNFPPLKMSGGAAQPTMPGQWQGQDGKYLVTFAAGSGGDDLTAMVESDRLTVKLPGMDSVALVFDRED